MENLNFTKFSNDKEFLYSVITLTIIISIVLLFFTWITSIVTLNNNNCTKYKKKFDNLHVLYPQRKINFSSCTNTSRSDYCNETSSSLRNYYIKTAYNCCNADGFKNNWVHLCAMEYALKLGVRCLDFEIYSMNDNPVIAVSLDQKNYHIKESYNKIDFSDALTVISNKAFSESYCPNWNDPLILHFRIMTENLEILDKMAYKLKEKLKNTLGKDYSYENSKENMGEVSLKDLLNKVIIIVDKSKANPNTTKLDEYVNLTSNSMFMRSIPFHDVKYSHDLQELINFNKKNMTMCYPDLKINMENPSPQLIKAAGCQFIAMTFQNINDNLVYYNKMFNDEESAFILKPKDLRHDPKTIVTPSPPNPELGYRTRVYKGDYYKITT